MSKFTFRIVCKMEGKTLYYRYCVMGQPMFLIKKQGSFSTSDDVLAATVMRHINILAPHRQAFLIAEEAIS